MNQPIPEFMQPQWFFPMFALMWIGIGTLLSVSSGWFSLSEQFRAEQMPTMGERFNFVSGSMGQRLFPVSYGGCLFVAVNEEGFGLSIFFPFRIFSPPMFIPWYEVESVESKRFMFFNYAVVRLRNRWVTISIRGKAGERIRNVYAQIEGAK